MTKKHKYGWPIVISFYMPVVMSSIRPCAGRRLFMDVLIDTLGAISAMLLVGLYQVYKRKLAGKMNDKSTE